MSSNHSMAIRCANRHGPSLLDNRGSPCSDRTVSGGFWPLWKAFHNGQERASAIDCFPVGRLHMEDHRLPNKAFDVIVDPDGGLVEFRITG